MTKKAIKLPPLRNFTKNPSTPKELKEDRAKWNARWGSMKDYATPEERQRMQREENERHAKEAADFAKSKTPTPKKRLVIKTVAPPLDIKPMVFQDCHHRTFLLLEEKPSHNRYLTVRDEEMQVIKLTHDLPHRDPSTGILISQETTSTTDLRPVLDKDNQPYYLKKAAQKLFDSLIVRTYDATKELCIILGKPVPEIPEEVQVARAAAAERLKAARAQRQSNLEEVHRNTPQHNLNDKGVPTMSKKAQKAEQAAATYTVAKKDGVKRGFVLEYVNKAAKLKTFTRDKLVAAVKGKQCTVERAIRYFTWCVNNGVFAKAK